MSAGRIESVRIRGFRSLADVELSNLQNANVLIGANGSGKSNFIRFFEMLRWMLRSRRLGEFVELHGGADDRLYGGNSVTPRMEGELALRTDKAATTIVSRYPMRIRTASSSRRRHIVSVQRTIRRTHPGSMFPVAIGKQASLTLRKLRRPPALTRSPQGSLYTS